MPTITLKPGREKSLLRLHPWVFSGAIARLEGDPGLGETVELRDSHGGFLAFGAYSPHSQIRVRAWSWDPGESIAPDFFRARLAQSLEYRAAIPGLLHSSAVRLVHGESDGLPGLIADRYGDTLVTQFLSAGVEHWRETLADLLLELTGARHLYERSDAEVRQLEGLVARLGPLRGDPPDQLIIDEHDLQFRVDLAAGHKTGFYLDQRQNRLHLRFLAQGKEVLDCFAYTGGFTVNALAGGALSVTAIDSSAEVLALARENVALNGFPLDRVEWLPADVFQQLRKFRDQGRQFDLIVLDPPKFAPTAAQAQKAARGYKDINLLAFKLLRPGGFLVTFSCSGGISAELFQKIVAGAALDAGIPARITAHLEQSPDHPVGLHFPEGAYLKGLVVRIPR
jgi:23S rRNA (cytosine1962-C5)-methyltransferase